MRSKVALGGHLAALVEVRLSFLAQMIREPQLVELYFVAGKLNDDNTIELQMIDIELRPFTS